MARIGCVSLPLLPLQVLLRANPEWRGFPAAVIEEDKPTSPLLYANRAARLAGVRPGMRYGDALSLLPHLRAAAVAPDALAAARAQILQLLAGFTPEIEPCPFDPERFWLNAAGITSLYGSLSRWMAAIREALAREGYRSHLVVGHTRFGSYLLARSWKRSGVVPQARMERELVRRMPAAALPLSLRVKERLRRLKVVSVRDFLALPREAVFRRFGEEARALFDFADHSGLLPLQPVSFEEPIVLARTFDAPLASVDPLAREVETLLDSALAALARRGRLLAELTLALRSEEGDTRSEAIRPAQPTSDRRLLLRLIRLRLSALLVSEGDGGAARGGMTGGSLRGGVVFLELRCTEAQVTDRQGELIEERTRRDLEAGAHAFALLRARFGNESVARASARNSHLLEQSFALDPIDRPVLPRPPGSGARSESPLRPAAEAVGAPAPGASAAAYGRRPAGAAAGGAAAGIPPAPGGLLRVVRRLFLHPTPVPPPAPAEVRTHDSVLLQTGWWRETAIDREYLLARRAGETLLLLHDRGTHTWLRQCVVDGVYGQAADGAAGAARPAARSAPGSSPRPPAARAGGRGPAAYVPLWCKSNFSFLEGASHPEELMERAAAYRLPALALTDRDGLYGIVKGYSAARSLAERDGRAAPRLIVGAEMSIGAGGAGGPARGSTGAGRGGAGRTAVAGGRPGSAPAASGGAASPGLILLAADRTGYQNLCELITTGRLRSAKGESSVTVAEACGRSRGLIALWTGDEELLPALSEAFRGRLYAVVARHRWFGDSERERSIRRAAARFALPLVAATEVLYHDRARQPLQDILTCIRAGATLEGAACPEEGTGPLLKPNAEHEVMSPADFAYRYRDDPPLVERTLAIAEECTFSLSEIEYRYPDEAVPDGLTTAEWLRRLTYDGATGRYGGSVPPAVRDQLERELALIEQLRYSGYFLTMHEIVQYCRKNGILCQGRGSAANSAVCYCLGITAVDPVRMELLFERFLSLERAEPPDIDLDIEHDRREEVIQHMYARYGRDRAAMVANVIRYRARSAIRQVGKALGLPAAGVDRCARLLPHWEDGLDGVVAEAGLDPALPAHRRLVELTREIVGFPRHLSIHPGGFLLGSEPVTHIVPVENATMADRTVIQWDKYDIETLNLFKVDLLGLGALTHLDYSFRLLAKHYGVDLSMATIPGEDPQTFEMIQRADTIGVFQIESRAQMAMLPRLKPSCYYDIVIEVSLVRPGPITGGMVHPYLKRRQGKEDIVYPHPKLEAVLKKTLGVPLFQEQVMKLAVVAAGYTPGEADQLRRDMAAWRFAGKIEKHRDRLISGMRKNGISAEFAKGVFNQIRGFGEYGFPESHAASFALIAYATAWMKRHYPAVFFCALLEAWPMGFYLPSTIVEDAKRHGVRVLPVDVLRSDWNCTLEGAGRRTHHAETQGSHPGPESRGGAGSSDVPALAIRMGLRYVKGVGSGDWERIRLARSRRPRSVAAFAAASSLARDTLERLAESGALAGFGIHRRQALWQALGALSGPHRTGGGARDSAASSAAQAGGRAGAPAPTGFTERKRLLDPPERPASFAAPTHSEEVAWDLSTSGHSARGHIVELFRGQLAAEGIPDSTAVNALPDKTQASFAGYVICRQMPGNAKGVVFMTFEDERGVVNVVAWKKVFARYRTLILTNWLLGVTGQVQSSDGVVHLVADSFWRPRIEGCGSDRSLSLESHDFY